ncbi:hypothetical protein [Nonomuraea sp. WAC 01424]|uniref:hypothetical protein n=1 Tax=Nonomuraea sp. WAC 01424 TaxID=2203200 RepID=UPI000F794FBE|nr:hypothetical protein [Nonomuraea sp. WAC 01424]
MPGTGQVRVDDPGRRHRLDVLDELSQAFADRAAAGVEVLHELGPVTLVERLVGPSLVGLYVPAPVRQGYRAPYENPA